jgi:hypothetical protein
MLAKVRALLAKAESTTFEEEAESLTAKAQELMARYAIDQAMVDAASSSGAGSPRSRRIDIADPYARAKAHLLAVVADANGCHAVWTPSAGLSTVIGFDTDLDSVELIFTSLLVQVTTAVLAAGPQWDHHGRSRTRSFRASFLVGFAARVGTRLREAAAAAQTDATAEHGESLLPVLASRAVVVDDALAAAFPKMASFGVSASNAAGFVAGQVAAENAALLQREVAR